MRSKCASGLPSITRVYYLPIIGGPETDIANDGAAVHMVFRTMSGIQRRPQSRGTASGQKPFIEGNQYLTNEALLDYV